MRSRLRGPLPAGFTRARPLVAVVAATALVAALGYAASGASSATGQTPSQLEAVALEPDGAPIEGAKSRVGRIAETDPALLGRSDSTPVNVVVKLDYDSVATYTGAIQGLAATSPKATGKKLKQNQAAVDAYQAHVAGVEQDIVSDIQSAVSGETIRDSYRVVYGGLSMTVPANQVGDLLSVDGVVAVQSDTLNQPLTSVTPEFTGASAVWPSLGGSSKAGEGVIVGVLDTGVWPEHPSWVDPGIDHPGGTYACQFGNAGDPAFTCNDKLIGAYAKTATYMSVLDALPGENCINATNVCSARDADGHGTHTSTTAAGGPVASTPLLGVNRGSISGMAPGAHVIMYRVCLAQGCFSSDSVSAVQQAILDGVDVLNFSISGGSSAYTDSVELSFLEAYEAGILVNASAGNAGPGAGTANHAGPWTNTVGASTSDRHFVGSLTLRASGGATYTASGATVTAGVSTPLQVVRASDIAGQPNDLCRPAIDTGVNFPAGSLTNKIVVCRREAGGRILKSYNASLGGAAGMILYNGLPNLGLNTDNHWVPSIHIENTATGTHPLIAFLDSNTGETATFTSGVATAVRGDVMTSFSSRGPLGDFIKPDVTAPGIQILAGHTPDPYDTNFSVGPPGQFFQAIAGTSMSSPHSAGISALVKDAHPDWTPGQIKSALMTSSVQDVLKENGVTPADPFDRGAGSIRANRAVSPTVTFDVTADEYVASATDPLNRIHLNLPSVNASPMPGLVTTTRTFKNVSGVAQQIRTSATSAAGTSIDVSPKTVVVAAGATATIEITIDATGVPNGQYFGQITLDPNRPRHNVAVLPVAFRKGQGATSLVHSCTPTTIQVGSHADCVVEAQNLSQVSAQASLTVEGPTNEQLRIQNVSAPGVPSGNGFTWSGTLAPALPPTVDSITPGGLPYVALAGNPVGGVGDETIVNFTVPAFKYGSITYNRIAMSSNGYAVVGGGTSADNSFNPQTFPNPARPNNVLAPFWTDLDPTAPGAPAGTGLRAALGTVGGVPYIVLEWRTMPSFSDPTKRTSFTLWVRSGATEGINWAYGTVGGTADPLNAGAENMVGTSGVNLTPLPPASNTAFTVNSGAPTPGGKVTITYDAFGRNAGVHDILATLTSSVVQGATTDKETITVTK